MCHENKISRRGRNLQKTILVLLSSPNNISVVLKLKTITVVIKHDALKRFPLENASLFSRKSSLDFDIALNLCRVVICFPLELAILDIWLSKWNWVFTCFNIVNWLFVVKFHESIRIRIKQFFETLKEKYSEQIFH